jgi:hypothetical protein
MKIPVTISSIGGEAVRRSLSWFERSDGRLDGDVFPVIPMQSSGTCSSADNGISPMEWMHSETAAAQVQVLTGARGCIRTTGNGTRVEAEIRASQQLSSASRNFRNSRQSCPCFVRDFRRICATLADAIFANRNGGGAEPPIPRWYLHPMLCPERRLKWSTSVHRTLSRHRDGRTFSGHAGNADR